jgi:hypothetical protein
VFSGRGLFVLRVVFCEVEIRLLLVLCVVR